MNMKERETKKTVERTRDNEITQLTYVFQLLFPNPYEHFFPSLTACLAYCTGRASGVKMAEQPGSVAT